MSQRGTGGVVDCGALEEDGLVTCEALAFLGEPTGEHGGPVINLQCAAGRCASGQPSHGAPHRTSTTATGQARLREDWRRSESEAVCARESDGPILAVTTGNGVALGPVRAEEGRS